MARKNPKKIKMGQRQQKQVRCHCGRPAVLRSAEGFCRTYREGEMVYVCSAYPACDSYVRASPDTLEPMGSLVWPELRRLRFEAHQVFNRLYLTGLMSKTQAYQWLARTVQAPMGHAHIGYLGEHYCRVVIQESKRLLQNWQRLRPQRIKWKGGTQYGAHATRASTGRGEYGSGRHGPARLHP